MAEELKLLATNSLRGVLAEALPGLERETGCAVAVSYDPARALLRRIGEGETADCVIAAEEALAELARAGRIEPASVHRLARSRVGVAVRAGAARPDIGSVEAFKRALLAAASIAHTREGASGIHFAQVIERLGIAEAIGPKCRVQAGGLVGERVARGEAELAVQQIPELVAVPGIEVVGPLPPGIEATSVLAGGVFSGAARGQAARTLLARLAASPGLFRAHGFDPLDAG